MLITPAFAPGASFGWRRQRMMMSLLPFVLIFVIMYFLILRPQQKRVKQHEEMVKNVRRGDTVVTSGGLSARSPRWSTTTRSRSRSPTACGCGRCARW